MAQSGLLFGTVKADLATVVANGVCADDPRVLQRTNEAIKMLLDEGVWVGTMATYDVTATGTILLLPKELENAIEVEVLGDATVRGQRDVTQGVNDCVNSSTYVDPSMAHDNPLVDLFLVPDDDDASIMRRKYDYPGLQANAVVRVTGAKRYIPLRSDGDALIIQNIPAIKRAILSLEFLERGASTADDSMKYMQMAVQSLQAEVKKHQLDPRRLMKRKADYQQDIITFAEGTLGRTRGRLALELSGLLTRGKAEISYLINRAVQMLIDNRNQLAIAGRISVHGTVEELDYAPATTADTDLAWDDYNDIRLMVQSFLVEGPDPQAVQAADAFQKQAFESQKLKLIEDTEKARHSSYTLALEQYVPGTFGYAVARLALEMPGGLSMTTTELERLASMAEMRLIEKGIWKGCLRTLSATIHGGEILFPRDVEAVLASDIFGHTIDIRGIFFEFQKNGPGHSFDCQGRFVDMGEIFFPETGSKRRRYNYRGSYTHDVQAEFVCKVRWVQKEDCDELTIKNFEALRLMAQSIFHERNEKWQDAGVAQADAIQVLKDELNEYLAGIAQTQNVDTTGFGFDGLGHAL